MCYYLSKHGAQLEPSHNHFAGRALMSTYFLQKMAASNYMILVGFLDATLNELQVAILHIEVSA
jgi:hypothetical protein